MEYAATFCNPAPFSDGKHHTNPDPFVLHWCGKYYCYATDEAGVKVSASDDLVHWEERGYAIQQKGRHAFWAPAALYWNGVFYLYYSSNPVGEDDGNGEKMQLAAARNPLGPFVWQKELFSDFSIDAHPVVWQGALYLFYSVNSWMGCDEKCPGTCILLDRMLAPDQPEGRPVPVILPSIPEEIFQKNRYGDGRDWYTLEGACFVPGQEQSFLLYSANCYTDTHYFVGYAVADNKPDLREMRWHKYPSPEVWAPLLKRSDTVEGTGHNTVVCAPNGVEPWIVYHGRDVLTPIVPGREQREMYLSPLKIYGDKLLTESIDCRPQALPAQPAFFASEKQMDSFWNICAAPLCYWAQMWFTPVRASTGACFDLFLRFQDTENALALRFHTGRRLLSVWENYHGVCRTLAQKTFPDGYDPFVPHAVEMRVIGGTAELYLDDMLQFSVTSRVSQGGFAAAPYHCAVDCYGVTLSEHLRLYGPQLWLLNEVLPVSCGTISEQGLLGCEGKLSMPIAQLSDCEIYGLLETQGGDACLTIEQEQTDVFSMPLPRGKSAFRYRRVRGTAALWVDGTFAFRTVGKPNRLLIQNAALHAWEQTKL